MKLNLVTSFAWTFLLYIVTTPIFAEIKTPQADQSQEKTQKSRYQSIDSKKLSQGEGQNLEMKSVILPPLEEDTNEEASSSNHKRKKFTH